MVLLPKRIFMGEEHYKWCLNEYETARHFLKSCGKPKDWYDRWLIDEARWTAQYFARCLQDKAY